MPVPDQLQHVRDGVQRAVDRAVERWRAASRARRRALAAGAAACVALVAVATVSVSADDGTAAGLRTTAVTTRSVDQVLDSVASLEPVSQASVAFPVAGTVESVSVSVGEQVTTGQELATLDTEQLERELREAQAELDQANLDLERALAGESVAGTGGSGGSGEVEAGGGLPTAGSTGSSGDPTTATASEAVWNTADDTVAVVEVAQAAGPTDAEIAAAQQAVLAAQQAADAAQATADAAVANASSICAAVGSADSAGFPAALAACMDALNQATAAQQAVTAAQQQVSTAAASLDALLEQRAAALAEQGSVTPSTEPEATPDTSGQPEAGTQGLGGTGAVSGGTDGGVSSAQLIALQQDVDVAVLRVLAAQQGVDQATIVSPVDGTVAAVQLAVGDEVEAASSTANVLVVSDGGFEATFSVSVDDLPDLEVGQPAEVLPDGSTEALAGEVVAIGVAAEGSSYPVTVGLTDDASSVGNGSVAAVSVTTDAADEVLAVPTSAVTVQGDRSTVQVVDGGDVREVEVQTGAVGSTWIEVLDGLEEGQEVVLADLDEPLPSGATDGSSVGSTDQITPFGGSGGGGAGGLPPFVGG